VLLRIRRLIAFTAVVLTTACSSPTVLPADNAGSTVRSAELPAGTTTTTLHVRVGPGGVREPRFVGRRILAFTNDTVTAFDGETLDPVWISEPCPSASWPGPYYLRPAEIAVVECDAVYRALDPDTGITRWEFDPQAEVTQLRLGGDTMSVLSGERLRVVDLETGVVRWDLSFGEPATSVDGDTVYLGSPNGIAAMDAQTAGTRWAIGGWAVTDVLRAGDTVYAWAWKGPQPFLLAIDQADGTLRWTKALADDNKTKTAIVGMSDHAVVVARLGTERGYEAFDRNDGELLWSHLGEVDEDHFYEVSVARNAVVLCSRNGDVVAYDDETATRSARLGESVDGYCPASGDLVLSVSGVDQEQLRVTTIPDL
jgi:outer membrane protein assembly factor BamB